MPINAASQPPAVLHSLQPWPHLHQAILISLHQATVFIGPWDSTAPQCGRRNSRHLRSCCRALRPQTRKQHLVREFIQSETGEAISTQRDRTHATPHPAARGAAALRRAARPALHLRWFRFIFLDVCSNLSRNKRAVCSGLAACHRQPMWVSRSIQATVQQHARTRARQPLIRLELELLEIECKLIGSVWPTLAGNRSFVPRGRACLRPSNILRHCFPLLNFG